MMKKQFSNRRLTIGMTLLGLTYLCAINTAFAQDSDSNLNFSDSSGKPIATAGFVGETGSVNVTSIIRSDISRSGGLVNFDAGGAVLGHDSKPNLADWLSRGAQGVVVGTVSGDGNSYTVSARLYDTAKKSTTADCKASFTPATMRSAAHQIADCIFSGATGIRGAFSTRLSYVDRVNGKYQLLISDSDGGAPLVALNSNEPIISPSWSPSGTQVAYVSFEQKKPVVYVHDLPTGQRTMIANYRGNNSAPSWSPDGQYLALALSRDGNTQVYRVSADGKNETRLTRSTGSVIDTEPTYSPDGQSIYFTSDRGGVPQIYKMPVTGESEKSASRVTFKGTFNTSPRISPDGTKMAYISNANGGFQTHLMDLQYGDSYSISHTSRDESPSFAANGQVVLYSTQQGSRDVLRASSIDGKMQQELPLPSGKARFPAWGPFMK